MVTTLAWVVHTLHESATKCFQKATSPHPYPLPSPLYVVPFPGLGRGIKGEGHFECDIFGLARVSAPRPSTMQHLTIGRFLRDMMVALVVRTCLWAQPVL